MRLAFPLLCGLGGAACFVAPDASDFTSDSSGGTSATTTAPSSTTSMPADTAPSTVADATGSTDGVGVSGSTDTTADTTVDGDSSGESGSSTGGQTDVWLDDFERPDSPNLSNGWLERTPGAFDLVGGEVGGGQNPGTYTDSIFYRSFTEARADATASVEFVLVGTNFSSTPQVHARIQEAGLARAGVLQSYLLYTNEPDELQLGRSTETGLVNLAVSVIDPPLVEGVTYRIGLTVSGTDPVEFSGVLESMGDDRSWTQISTIAGDDETADRLTTAGSLGASANNQPAFTYDNFMISSPVR